MKAVRVKLKIQVEVQTVKQIFSEKQTEVLFHLPRFSFGFSCLKYTMFLSPELDLCVVEISEPTHKFCL